MYLTLRLSLHMSVPDLAYASLSAALMRYTFADGLSCVCLSDTSIIDQLVIFALHLLNVSPGETLRSSGLPAHTCELLS